LLALPDPVLCAIVPSPVIRDGQRLHVEAQVALKLLELTGEPPLEGLSPGEARARVARDAAVFEGPKIPIDRVDQLELQGAEGPLAARLYVPDGAPPEASATQGLLVYFHGGGFVVGDLATHDNVCRFLARGAGVRVLSVDYRRAPEHRFPAALEDAVAAFRHAAERASEFGADRGRVAVAGDSAGANLAAGVARLAAGGGGPVPAFQLLFYPWLDLAQERRSHSLFAQGFYLSTAELRWYKRHYLLEDSQAFDPRCSPLHADDLAGVAPAYVVTAGFDPLRDEGEEYAARLRRAGVRVALRRQSGLIHGFINTVQTGHAAREAGLEAAGALRLALAG
jgi:acetyl esterase